MLVTEVSTINIAGVNTSGENFPILDKFAALSLQLSTLWHSLQQPQHRHEIKSLLFLVCCHQKSSLFHQKNQTTYWVRQKSSVEEVLIFTPIADKLKRERTNMPRFIIFCKKYEECAILYHFFKFTRIYRTSWGSQSFSIQARRHVHECY